MSLDECMRTHSERQLRLRLRWLDQQLNTPSLTDHYLMVVACEVRRVLMKDPNKVQPKDFRLAFDTEQGYRLPEPELTPEQVAAKKARLSAISKATWLGRVGMAPMVVEGLETKGPTPGTAKLVNTPVDKNGVGNGN